MSREDVTGGGELARLRQGESLLGDEMADLLEDGECRVAFVDVPDGRRDPEAFERPYPTDAERDLLANPHLLIAGIQPCRNVAIIRVVFGKVGVEEEERDLPDLRDPDQKL
jgi:hypothetical protein